MVRDELLRSAVQAAKTGQRQQARELFLRVVEQDAHCELAWIWLSDLVENPDDRITALENALDIRPNNPPVRARLTMLRTSQAGGGAGSAVEVDSQPNGAKDGSQLAIHGTPMGGSVSEQTEAPGEGLEPISGHPFLTHALDRKTGQNGKVKHNPQPFTTLVETIQPETFTDLPGGSTPQQDGPQSAYRQALALAKEGRREQALNLLLELVEVNEQNATAWLLIAQLQPAIADKIAALKRVVKLQPENHTAKTRLKRLEKLDSDPFQRGVQYEERGQIELAISVYLSIETYSHSAVDRLEAKHRITNLKILQEAQSLHPIHPTLNLLRLTAGPALFFGILIFTQDGLNPLNISPAAWLGEVSVLSGSLLVTTTGQRPLHPYWVKQFGRPGSGDEPETRFWLHLLGWGLLAAPYVLLLIEAVRRLLIFQAGLYE